MALGSNTLGLLFKIGVDSKDATTQLKNLTDQAKTGFDNLRGSVANLGPAFDKFNLGLGLAAGGIAGFIGAAIDAAKATADWVNELDRASQATSIEIRLLAQLEGAFKEAGGSLNSMIGTFDIFASKLEQAREGNNKLIDLLEKYGIVSKDVTAATDEAFRALGAMTDQTEKARVATELFGKGGTRQILQFKDLKDGIKGVTAEYKGLGDAIDPKLVEAARAYEAESKKLDAALVANRSVIAGIVLPSWVEFNASIRRALETLTDFSKLADRVREQQALLQLRKPPAAEERGLGGEEVSEAEARASTQKAIAARDLETARKVKEDRVKVAKEGKEAVNEELEDALADYEKFHKQLQDTFIKTLDEANDEFNEAILQNRKNFEKYREQLLEFAGFLKEEMDKIFQAAARGGGGIPGGGKGIPGLPDPDETQAQLDAIHDSFGGFFNQLKKGFEDSGIVFSTWGELAVSILERFAGAIEDSFAQFILTGQFGAIAFKRLVAQILAAVAVESAIKAIFELAEGLAALARYDPFSAGLHFASAKTYGLVALAAGVTGLAIGAAGGLGGGTTGAAAGAGGFGGQSAAPGPVNIYQGAAATGLGIAAQQLAVMSDLNNKITTAAPGDVLQRGVDQNPLAVGHGVNEAGRRDGTVTRNFLEIAGLRPA